LTYEPKAKGSNPKFRQYRLLLKLSPWGQRGWTFQELLCSKRLVFFLPQGILWECHCVNWWNGLPGEFHTLHDEDDQHILPPKSFHDQVFPEVKLFKQAVIDYNRRQLTRDNDIERAFAGVVGNFADIYGPFIFGHPAILFDWTLLWQPGPDARFRSTAAGRFHEEDESKVTPNWSWMSMQGRLRLDFWNYAESCLKLAPKSGGKEVEPVVKWNIYNGIGSETSILLDIDPFHDQDRETKSTAWRKLNAGVSIFPQYAITSGTTSATSRTRQ
jgi:hypothetical protein